MILPIAKCRLSIWLLQKVENRQSAIGNRQ
jgi:hypothetical protein